MELALQTKGEQNVSIATFRSRGEKLRVCKFVDVRMALREGRMRDLTVLVVPIIHERLVCQPITLYETVTSIARDFPLLMHLMGRTPQKLMSGLAATTIGPSSPAVWKQWFCGNLH